VCEEVAQSELEQLLGSEVVVESEPLREVVRPNLDARLTHLEGGFRYWMLPLLDDERPEARRIEVQLARETAAGQPAPEDHDIEVQVRHGLSESRKGCSRVRRS
jgi:hypothetical protein